MLGHQLLEDYSDRHEVIATIRGSLGSVISKPKSKQSVHLYDNVGVENFEQIEQLLDEVKPEAVINAVGIVKQRAEAKDAIQSLEVNALFPQRLAQSCIKRGIRLVHMSTDCVFSGRTGHYKDDSFADADDLYGRTKYLGEVNGPGILTLRTSIIGLELTHKKSLIEWFLAQRGSIHGYTRAIYSGFTTREMGNIIEVLLNRDVAPSGIYNVSSEPIDKYTILNMLGKKLQRRISIARDDTFQCDRSLDSTKFRREFSYTPPTWDVMLDELANQIISRDEQRQL